MEYKEEILQHVGILGMRWGVRKGSFVFRKKTTTSDTQKDEPAKKSVKTMSDDELRQKISRIQMESQYAQLTESKLSKGRKEVTKVLVDIAKTTVTNYLKTELGKALAPEKKV